jgi:kynurenine 3-monooxygenase
LLLSKAEKTPGVKILFDEKCDGYDLTTSTISILKEDQHLSKIPFDTLIAADGVHSKIRYQMQRRSGFNYSQLYSKHANKELTIPVEKAMEYNLQQNHLHIWPRDEFMLIGFPNPNKSFTCHLQIPVENNEISFREINSESKLLSIFNKLFPDAIQLMPNLEDEFFQNLEIPMLTIRCSHWNIEDKILLIGDAAHGIWPSYGQGVNAGFEDCIALEECLSLHPNDTLAAFTEFQNRRKENADTIANLSENHANEIRNLVADPNFLLRKKLERKINLLFPTEYFSLYSRIAFTTLPYEEALRVEPQYKQIIDELLTSSDIKVDMNSVQSENLIHQVMGKFYNKDYNHLKIVEHNSELILVKNIKSIQEYSHAI